MIFFKVHFNTLHSPLLLLIQNRFEHVLWEPMVHEMVESVFVMIELTICVSPIFFHFNLQGIPCPLLCRQWDIGLVYFLVLYLFGDVASGVVVSVNTIPLPFIVDALIRGGILIFVGKILNSNFLNFDLYSCGLLRHGFNFWYNNGGLFRWGIQPKWCHCSI